MALDRRSGAGANQEAVRRHNLGTLLSHVHHDEQLSRAELTARMGLNRSTIAALVGELESLAVVEQVSPGGERTSAGRPSLHVRPAGRDICVLAVELRVERVEAARVGLGGHVLDRLSRPLPRDREPEDVSDVIAEACIDLVAAAPGDTTLVGLGVGLPGVVGLGDGLVRFAPNLGWSEVHLAKLLHDRIGMSVDVQLGNDADLGVLSEHIRGAAAKCDDAVYLSGDVGVGGGVVAGGQALHGAGGYAGELGHMRTNPRGRTCRCGSHGCWETEIGASAVAAALQSGSHEIDDLGARLRTVSQPSAALRTVGRHLGMGVANIINIFNPEVVIFGGLLRDLYPVVEDEVQAELHEGSLDAPSRQTRLILPALDGDSVLLGASELAFGPLLADPIATLADARGAAESLLGGPR